VEAFQAWMIETRSASTAVNKHKGLQQFFKWLLVDECAIDRSPMERVRQPKTPIKLIPVMRTEDTGKLLEACKGKGFASLRDEALIRLYCNTGARLSEVGNLLVTDLDLNTESVHFHGKGAKGRRVRFGPKTARSGRDVERIECGGAERDLGQVPSVLRGPAERFDQRAARVLGSDALADPLFGRRTLRESPADGGRLRPRIG
jgi:integrase